jgi:hypothetical protein
MSKSIQSPNHRSNQNRIVPAVSPIHLRHAKFHKSHLLSYPGRELRLSQANSIERVGFYGVQLAPLLNPQTSRFSPPSRPKSITSRLHKNCRSTPQPSQNGTARRAEAPAHAYRADARTGACQTANCARAVRTKLKNRRANSRIRSGCRNSIALRGINSPPMPTADAPAKMNPATVC